MSRSIGLDAHAVEVKDMILCARAAFPDYFNPERALATIGCLLCCMGFYLYPKDLSCDSKSAGGSATGWSRSDAA